MPEPARPIDPTRPRPRSRAVTFIACIALLGGCAALPADHGRGAVAELLAARDIPLHEPAEPAAGQPQVQQPDGPLALADAISWGLTYHPGLRAEFARLGIAAADIYEAGRLANPRIGLGYLWSTSPDGGHERSLGITQRFTELITLSARRRLAAAGFEEMQAEVAAAVQGHALAVADAWFDLAGAVEVAAMDAALADAARIQSELANRFFEAGNLSRRALAEARAGAAEARLGAIAAAERVSRARNRLAALLGLPGVDDSWTVGGGLPPPGRPAPADVEIPADDRLDLLAARRGVVHARTALETARRYRYLGVTELGPRWEGERDGPERTGLSLAVTLPLFDHGDGQIARAESALIRAEAGLAALELDRLRAMDLARVEIARAAERYEILANGLLPARREIVAARQLEVNFMLTGPFELLTERQREYAVSRDALAALTDYWKARVAYAAAAGLPPPDISDAGPAVTAAGLRAEPAGDDPNPENEHSHHHLHQHDGAHR
ncbi:MAG: TolC family protein [Pseudomonadales bacterium]|nr:TolC family protein [Pseudomonadales bacterium]